MIEKIRILNNESGSVIIMAIIALALLTVLGLISSRTSSIESQIARNDMVYNRNFYRSEGAMMQGARVLENENDTMVLKGKNVSWLNSEDPNDLDFFSDPTNWITSGTDQNAALSQADPTDNGHMFYTVVDRGIADMSSLSLVGDDALYNYSIYGMYQSNDIAEDRGLIMLEIGYKKRW